MKKLFVFLLLLSGTFTEAQLLRSSPSFPKETDANVVITVDALRGNLGLKDYNPDDVYVHIGCITNMSTGPADWKYVKFTWGTSDLNAKANSAGANRWSYTLTGASMRAFYGIVNAAEKIQKIVILFRSGNGSRVQRNIDGSDMYFPVYDPTLKVRIEEPFRQPTYIPQNESINKNIGDNINILGLASESANLKISFNGNIINSATGTTLSANPVITVPGQQRIIAEAEVGGIYKRDTLDFVSLRASVIQDLPAGMVDGINYSPSGTSATLVLFAPLKKRATVIGDFNNWTAGSSYYMKQTSDGNRLWLQLDGLNPGQEYAYQYLVDDTLKVADYNAEKILDPANDSYITAATYPNLKPYPTGVATGIVSVLQTNKPTYNWSNNSFTRPDKRSLSMYELHLRDFVEKHDWKTLIDTLSYLKRLGINSIHVMPFNEFEGNSSWGYNPSFYFAPDKYYGPENELRRFIDSAHQNGMEVIMDMVLNHSYGQSPMVQMYWDAANNRPAANSPWFNAIAPHSWLEFGYDFNHEAQATKDFASRVVRHWLSKYKVDGIRWDFTKGFSQRSAPTESASAAYDASRIVILKRIYDTMQAVSPGSVCILEHFCDNSEEIELANYGMLLWANMNYNYNEASMGYVGTSNFQGVLHTQRGFTTPNLLGYAESHDEERLMYKNEQYGNSAQAPTYDVKNLIIGLKRQEMVAAFLIPVPGPKLIWEFGELGYDYSINRCENGSIDNNCRTNPKPIVWNYYQDANRKALFDIYSKLNKLKTAPVYNATFTTNDISYDLGAAVKWMKINGPALRVLVIGNFDVTAQTTTITFPQAGTWYSYLTGSTRIATGTAESITLQPGEYYVYTSVNAQQVLPLKLLSFNGSRTSAAVQLEWQTTNEINVQGFEVERSVDGRNFTRIGNLTASATQLSQAVTYHYKDSDNRYVPMTDLVLYYRLKMVDKDGNFSYSAVIALKPFSRNQELSIYPNPVKRSNPKLYLRGLQGVSNSVTISILDAGGRIVSTRSYNASAISNGIITMDLKGISPAVYTLRLQSASTVMSSRLLVTE